MTETYIYWCSNDAGILLGLEFDPAVQLENLITKEVRKYRLWSLGLLFFRIDRLILIEEELCE
jgi:hypothetical protein